MAARRSYHGDDDRDGWRDNRDDERNWYADEDREDETETRHDNARMRENVFSYDDVMSIVSRVVDTIVEDEHQEAEARERQRRRLEDARDVRPGTRSRHFTSITPRDNDASVSYNIFRRVSQEVDARAREMQATSISARSPSENPARESATRVNNIKGRDETVNRDKMNTRECDTVKEENKNIDAYVSPWHDDEPRDDRPFAEICNNIRHARQQRIAQLKEYTRRLEREEKERKARITRAEQEVIPPSPEHDEARRTQWLQVCRRREREYVLHAARAKHAENKLLAEEEERVLAVTTEEEIRALMQEMWKKEHIKHPEHTLEERVVQRIEENAEMIISEAERRFNLEKEIHRAAKLDKFDAWEANQLQLLREREEQWEKCRQERIRQRTRVSEHDAQHATEPVQGPHRLLRRPARIVNEVRPQPIPQREDTHAKAHGEPAARNSPPTTSSPSSASASSQHTREYDASNASNMSARRDAQPAARNDFQTRQPNAEGFVYRRRLQDAVVDEEERKKTLQTLKELKINSYSSTQRYFQEKKKDRKWQAIEYCQRRERMAAEYIARRRAERNPQRDEEEKEEEKKNKNGE